MEQRPRQRWISVVCFSRSVALKFGAEDLQFFFRQVQQIALGRDRGGRAGIRHIRREAFPSSIISARDLTMRSSQVVDQPRSRAGVRFPHE